MYYFLRLGVPGFFVREQHRRNPEFQNRSLAVVREKQIIDACPQAAARGVLPGMAEREARIILEDGRILPYRSEEYRAAGEELRNACLGVVDSLRTEDDDGVWLDLSPHPDPAHLAEALLEAIPDARAGAGARPWLAQAAYETTAPDRRFVWSELGAGLSVQALAYFDPKLPEALQALGCHHMHQVQQLSVKSLRDHFPAIGERVYRELHGLDHTRLPANYPPASVQFSWRSAAPVDDESTLDRVLDQLSARLAQTLQKRGQAGRDVHLKIEHETARPEWRHREFARALWRAGEIRQALRRLLAQPKTPISGLGARMSRLEKAPHPQRLLNGFFIREPRAEIERVAAQLQRKFGPEKLRTGSELPSSYRQRMLRVWRDVNGWV